MVKRSAVVVIARTALGAAAEQEMARLAGLCSTQGGRVAFAFLDQGEPSLRDVVHGLREERVDEIVLVPLLVPMEPGGIAFLQHTLHRWQMASPGEWPVIRVDPAGPAAAAAMPVLLAELVERARASAPLEPPVRPVPDGSIVPGYKRRLLVCLGGPCQAVGATLVWGHMRSEHKRLNLRTTGDGTGIAKTSCLGPCKLAPVVQVYPDGVLYGGVDERGLDRIVQEHLLGGRVVDDLVYLPSPEKQRLRSRATEDTDT